MSECSHDCSSCGSKGGCAEQKKLSPCEGSRIKKLIGVVSGKGGVGKSLTTSALATLFARKDFNVAILDGDILGSSIPNIFGLKGNISGDGRIMYPAVTKSGIKVISVNMMLESPESPVIWRGSMVSNVIKQFYTDVLWEEIDYMFIDMPPGTGDVPLTAFQSLPIDGIIIVTSPQELVQMIVKKAYNMANMLSVPIIGLVENFSYLKCPHCEEIIYPFGKGRSEEVAKTLNIPLLACTPIDENIAMACDKGTIEELALDNYKIIAEKIIDFSKKL